MRPAMIVLAAVLLLFPGELRAEEAPSPAGDAATAATADSGESPERKCYPLRDIEWASVSIGTGYFLFNFRASGPTLIWERFYLTTLSLDFGFFGARYLALYGVPNAGSNVIVSQSYGCSLLLDQGKRQELRVGILAGFLWSSLTPLLERHVEPPCEYCSHWSGWLGFALGPELTYLYHVHKHLSLTAGFRSAFAVAGRGDYYPFPYLAAQVGLAF